MPLGQSPANRSETVRGLAAAAALVAICVMREDRKRDVIYNQRRHSRKGPSRLESRRR